MLETIDQKPQNQDQYQMEQGMEFTLVLLSGINNEGKNVLFGFGLVKNADFNSLRWVLKRFLEFSKHP